MCKSTSSIFALLLTFFILFSCKTETTSTSDTAAETEVKEEEKAEVEPTVLVENDAYMVKLLKGEIKSPMKQLTSSMGDKDITITYGSPSVKGRTIFGDLVPYNQVWRTGANEATVFTNSAPVEIQGETLPAGSYALFTIPTEGDWTLIFNETAEQWGSYDHDETKDVLRVSATPVMNDEASETMEFMIDEDQVVLLWDKVKVPFTVK